MCLIEQRYAKCRKLAENRVGGRPQNRYNPPDQHNQDGHTRCEGALRLTMITTSRVESAKGAAGSNGSMPDPRTSLSAAMARPAARPRRRATAQSMAASQRDISVSEFFAKNRHLLGFDNPRKALLTTVKEAVDNALDACEEAGILPEIWVHIQRVGPDRFKVGVQDNGPGIVKQQIPLIFGKLLYGSKFHRMRMSRGQQGIGISAAGMHGLLTTGKPVKIISKVSKREPAHYYEIQIDTKRNLPEILNGRGDGVEDPARRGRREKLIEKHEHRMDRRRPRHAGDDRARGPLPARPRQRRRLSRTDGHRQPARGHPLHRSRRQQQEYRAGHRGAAARAEGNQAASLRRRVGPAGGHAQGHQGADHRAVLESIRFRASARAWPGGCARRRRSAPAPTRRRSAGTRPTCSIRRFNRRRFPPRRPIASRRSARS